MIDRALKSCSTPYKLAMRILLFFMSSVAQIEAEISTYFHEGVGYIGPRVIPLLIEIQVSIGYSVTSRILYLIVLYMLIN